MIRENEYYAYLTFFGEFDPAEITASIGIEPTDCWRKGDRSEQTHMERTFSRWSLFSRLERVESLERHLDDVLEQCAPVSTRVAATREQHQGHIEAVGYFYRPYPGIVMEANQIRGMADMKLGIGFDFYYMYSDRREDS